MATTTCPQDVALELNSSEMQTGMLFGQITVLTASAGLPPEICFEARATQVEVNSVPVSQWE